VSRTCRWAFLPIFLAQACFFIFVSQHRLIDADEGFYALASRLVTEHKLPYEDFFYQQAPLLPYVYGYWLKATGFSWFSARLLSGVFTAIVGGLIYYVVARETGKWTAATISVLLFAANIFVFAWFPLVKTFAMATAFLFMAYVLVSRLPAKTSAWCIAVSGSLFGLTADTRSYIVGVVPIFVWWFLRQQRGGAQQLLCFTGGFLLGILPSLVLLVRHPAAYLFDNLGYHAIRTDKGLIGDWPNKIFVTRYVLIGREQGRPTGLLVLTCLVLLFVIRPRRSASVLAFFLALALGLVSLLPTPVLMQYFCVLVPFVIVGAVCQVSDFFDAYPFRGRTWVAGAVSICFLAYCVAFGAPAFRGHLFTGSGVPGLRDLHDAPNWTLKEVSAVSYKIDQLTVPGEEIASFWPGYIFASWAEPYPGFEDNFGMFVAKYFPSDKRRQYHIVGDEEISRLFAQHGPRIAVVGNQGAWNGGPAVLRCVELLHADAYVPAARVGDTLVYRCCAASSRTTP
jgi:hypothetical protein